MSTRESKHNALINIFLGGRRANVFFKWIKIVICIFAVIALFFVMMFTPPKYTERTAISDYGHYDGTGTDSFTECYIQSFFPKEIEDSFSAVKYSYKAENTDTYGFEAYLEFTIEDKTIFKTYISKITSNENWHDFAYAPGYKEYCIENVFDLDIDDTDDPSSIYYRQIVYAKIRKILYSPEEQRIIYVAIGVYDGGGIGTNYLNVFFERFQIDPVEYEQAASSGYGIDPFGIS